MKRMLFPLMLVATMAPSAVARADVNPARCVAWHVEAQTERRAQRLVEGLRAARACSVDACPRLIRTECVELAAALEASMPTITVDVVEGDEDQPVAAALTLDGEAQPVHAKDRPINPGSHRLRAERDGRATELGFVIFEGEKGRRLRLRLPPPPRPTTRLPLPSPSLAAPLTSATVPLPLRPSPAPPRTRELWPWLTTSISLASFSLFTGFGLAGMRMETAMSASCAPACSPDRVSEMRRNYAIADVALGISVVAAAAALYTWLR